MENNELSKMDETKLTGRIYPAIRSCVANRYYILIGIVSYYIFILTSDLAVYENIVKQHFDKWAVIFFGLFTILNTINYYSNAFFQWKIERFGESFREKFVCNYYIELVFLILIAAILFFTWFKIPAMRPLDNGEMQLNNGQCNSNWGKVIYSR